MIRKLLKLALAVAVIVALLWFAPHAGSILVVNRPEKADAIIVAAGSADPRTARALQLLHEGLAPVVLLDASADISIYERTYAQLAQEYVDSHQIGQQVKVCPIRGDSTVQEAHSAAACLAALHPTRVLLVTSSFHTRRAFSIFHHVLPQYHWSVAAADDSYFFGTRWWTNREWAKTTLQEWQRLIWWELIERWRN